MLTASIGSPLAIASAGGVFTPKDYSLRILVDAGFLLASWDRSRLERRVRAWLVPVRDYITPPTVKRAV
jgi:hypothetical protein